MAITVRIPSVLRTLTNGQEHIALQAGTVQAALDALEGACPGVKARICDDQGRLRKFVNVFVGEEDIRFLDGPATALKDGDILDIVPAIAGG